MAESQYTPTERRRQQIREAAKAQRERLKLTEGYRVLMVEPWVREDLKYRRRVGKFKNISEVLKEIAKRTTPEGLLVPLPLKDKHETRYLTDEERKPVSLILTRWEWSRLSQADCTPGEVLERILLEDYEPLNSRLVLRYQGDLVALREYPQLVDPQYYLRMTRKEEYTCENKHEFRRFHRLRILNDIRKAKYGDRPFVDHNDPGRLMDEAPADDPRIALLQVVEAAREERLAYERLPNPVMCADGTRRIVGAHSSPESAPEWDRLFGGRHGNQPISEW